MKVKIGDVIECMGMRVKIAKIFQQDYWHGSWDIEFEDERGNYHHWKQECDGGKLIQE